MFYAKSSGGFYDPKIHIGNIPGDAVELTREYYDSLFIGQAAGKIIIADAGGYPILADRPAPTPEELAAGVRAERDRLLAASDWTDTLSAATRLGDALYQQWQEYRQALRDVTDQPGFPASIDWPVSP